MANPEPKLLAVPNFSEGTDDAVISALTDAASQHATLLDRHSDSTHNRTVLTLGGPGPDLVEAVRAAAATAIERIDMTAHLGAHPCVGAIDVAPIVFPDAAREGAAGETAQALALRLAALDLPVFLYGGLAATPERRERAFFRRGGIASLAARMSSADLVPDLGPPESHPTAGAVLVTARPPLAAFNLELEGASIGDAREIASALRESGGGPAGVRAIAIDLAGDRVQVSANVQDPIAVPLAEVVERVSEHAARLGASVIATELLGLVPEAALSGFPVEIPMIGGDVFARTIEARLGAAP